MTMEDFRQVLQLLHGGAAETPAGLYPRWPLTAAAIAVWYKMLAPYAVQQVCAAVEAAYATDPAHLPAPQALRDWIRAQAPAPLPPPPWWTPEVTTAVQQHGMNGAFAVLRDQQRDSHWAACHQTLYQEGLTVPGREAAYLARCRQYAAQYPADRQSWLAEIARVEARLQAAGRPVPRATPPPRAGSFTHVSAPRRRFDDAHD